MNEAAARDVVLVRAFETVTPRSDAWTDDDRTWASRAAAEIVGGGADPEHFLARRAALAVERLASRERGVRRMLRATHWRRWVGWVVIGVAFAVGLVMDEIGPAHRVNILAFPLFALLVWNLTVYMLMIGVRVVSLAAPEMGQPGPIRRTLARFAYGLPQDHVPVDAPAPLVAFLRNWLALSAPVLGARVASVLHRAAFVLALGAIISLYLRGIVFEYRAGWESTFLEPSSVQRLLSLVLAPATAVTGIAVPDAQHIAGIRFPASAGENAAPWLHLYAATIVLFVLLPRALLASFGAWRERRLTGSFPLPIDDSYFRNLLRIHRGEAARLHIVPYSYQLSPQATLGLQSIVNRIYGPGTKVTIAPTIPFGDEDALPPGARPADHATLTLALFSLAATPEAEHHCVLLNKLEASDGAGTPVAVLIDESGFRQRFADRIERIDERRDAWRRLLEKAGRVPAFVDLASPDLAQAEGELNAAIDQALTASEAN